MLIYYDNRFDTIQFGFEALKRSLNNKNIFFIEKRLSSFVVGEQQKTIAASFEAQGVRVPASKLENGGFEIATDGNITYITGKDHAGLMYGLLDAAETVELFGIEGIKDKVENPFMKMRGIKFNLPFEPYDDGDPIQKNIETCKDTGFWRDYIDFLARNRYNCLSLWTEHPFHMMFRLDKYPDTCPYSDVELEKYKELYKFILSHAKSRGIDVYLITWNIRITSFVAKGLGLPPELGDMSDRYDVIHDECNHIPNSTAVFDHVRQHLDIIKDYFKECIRTLAMTYRDLKGLGTNCAEEMVGTAIERQNWVMETYLEAVKESGRDLPFIMRTNCGNGKTAKLFLDAYPSKEKYISWKYSNAHMYSHPQPRFEEHWGAWDGMSLEDEKILYTVRNDDFHTLRWGDPDFIRDYVKGMGKPYVHGFYWGADGYIWASEFQHVPHKHKTWKYDFERQWYQFELLGRLGYNPNLSDDIWIARHKMHYGELWGEKVFQAMKAASRIVPAVNRLFWINYDFEWHPESLLTVFGFKTILDFMKGKPMPLIGTTGLTEYVENELKGVSSQGETPVDIINIINTAVKDVESVLTSLMGEIPEVYMDGELGCTLLDIEAWGKLGSYYYYKFLAAMKLLYYERTGDESFKSSAVECLEHGLEAWKELSLIWASHYMPYKMVRSKYIFGWSYYIDEVKKDIEIARSMKCSKNA